MLAFTATAAYAALTYEIVQVGYGDWHHPKPGDYMDSLYKIRITGGSGDLYITDWVSGINTGKDRSSIETEGATRYGYSLLSTNDPDKKDSIGHVVEMSLAANREENGSYTWENGETLTRFKYKLGTFSEGDELELFMGNGVDASTSYTTMYKGAINRGTHADALLMYEMGWRDELDYETKEAIRKAAQLAMPLAELAFQGDNIMTSGETRVHFGFAAGTGSGEEEEGGKTHFSGSPLPGGLSIALVSGLFAFGFWFVRRRKSIAA